MTSTLHRPTGALGTDVIDAATLRQLLADDPGLRILDVRSGAEFASVHIGGSYNVPLDTLAEHASDLADVDHPVVLVCKSGARADQAHTTLSNAGKQQLHLLDGGLDSWTASGNDVVRGSSKTWALDRQVRLAAGSLSLVGMLLSVAVPRAKWLAGAVAAGLTFSAVSNTCAMGNALGRLPYNRGAGCDIEGVLTDMQATS
ncbi:MAG: rhodanese-like domain-containing protein [Ilumatobacter sp.]|jgi:rhodanese-related sulfurtransferase|uniref:rhodanese-like domain-containing protein n=2 Tax=Ilumatobacter sp. TaxID=1967498 RepID=UPI001DD53662|nr:rhodanese-like domain-containing protein [Ilumatobacter sp.]MBT5277554.1 rhodanese-like domain-containing protein [Ilumatobacter sp.]MBT5553924.1 rhodanese-like domain-containing protein [Ilumatobacter sp.]MBT5866786.1 rhodanese-like domain-containing protein [Ilumatobacter sp.]MBT7430933.1 rhodanese-like domain-containing protein [Ilumatobacter sp.]